MLFIPPFRSICRAISFIREITLWMSFGSWILVNIASSPGRLCHPRIRYLSASSWARMVTFSSLSVRPARSRLLYNTSLRFSAHRSSRYGFRLLSGILASRVSMMRSIFANFEARARRPASICPGNHVNGLLDGTGNVERGTNCLNEERRLAYLTWTKRQGCRGSIAQTIHSIALSGWLAAKISWRYFLGSAIFQIEAHKIQIIKLQSKPDASIV